MTSILLSTKRLIEIWQNVIAVYNSRSSLSSLKGSRPPPVTHGRTWRLQAVDRHPECQHKKEKTATLRRFLKFKSVKFEVGKRLCYLCLPPSKEEHNAQLNFFYCYILFLVRSIFYSTFPTFRHNKNGLWPRFSKEVEEWISWTIHEFSQDASFFLLGSVYWWVSF